MLKLFQSFLGLLFFCFLIIVLWIKSQPSYYHINLEQSLAYPKVSYQEYLESKAGGAFWTMRSDSIRHLAKWIADENIQRMNADKNSITFELNSKLYFKIFETWTFSEDQQTLSLSYSFKVPFLSKAFLFRDKHFLPAMRKNMFARYKHLNKIIEDRYAAHNWEYTGVTEYPLTYYLAIEGQSNWQNLSEEYHKGHEKLRSYAKENAIPTQDFPFVVFPQLQNKKVQWRAALAVDKFYNTQEDSIKCKRYKGGKVLQLIHKGPLNQLQKSWNILFDSLQLNTQAYPAFQKKYVSDSDTHNPLNWETILYLPIQ